MVIPRIYLPPQFIIADPAVDIESTITFTINHFKHFLIEVCELDPSKISVNLDIEDIG
ncbi:Hypothetical protein HVR_LOCUS930 [uncultured virus]|nr:Hypothetical protein HVR_LOCUS930 [uncultured virus]